MPDDLEHIPCFETHSCFVAAPGYPCDFTRAYTTEEIAAFPLILLEKKASSRTYLEKYFLQSGVRLTPEIELGARSLLVDLAKIASACGRTREFVQGELAAGEIRELSTAFSIPPRTVDLCMLRNVRPAPQPNVLPAMCLKNYRANPFPFKFCKVSVILHIESA